MSRRQLDTVAPIAPTSITTKSCEATVGVDPRTFRDLVRRWEIPHARAGNLLIVDATVWREVIARRAAANEATAPAALESVAEAPLTADAVLASLGFRAR